MSTDLDIYFSHVHNNTNLLLLVKLLSLMWDIRWLKPS
uniref:Uncharacterized protein n=1 Tax=Moniliophthora roreri TaxID=221103 RepID=A0A0W0GCV3_MONRR